MKNPNSILALIAALLLALSSLQAHTSNAYAENPLTKKVKNLKTPATIIRKNKSEKIKVYFSVDEKGNVNDVFIDTDNKEIEKDLTQQFMKLNFKELSPCVMNSVVLNFVLY